MPTESILFAADVKCYFCGHISGQIVGPKDKPLRASNFVPRTGYTGVIPRNGQRMRCERCQGPVFLEDAEPSASAKVAFGKVLATESVAAKPGAEAA